MYIYIYIERERVIDIDIAIAIDVDMKICSSCHIIRALREGGREKPLGLGGGAERPAQLPEGPAPSNT